MCGQTSQLQCGTLLSLLPAGAKYDRTNESMSTAYPKRKRNILDGNDPDILLKCAVDFRHLRPEIYFFISS